MCLIYSYPSTDVMKDELLFNIDIISEALRNSGHDTSRLQTPYAARPSGLGKYLIYYSLLLLLLRISITSTVFYRIKVLLILLIVSMYRNAHYIRIHSFTIIISYTLFSLSIELKVRLILLMGVLNHSMTFCRS